MKNRLVRNPSVAVFGAVLGLLVMMPQEVLARAARPATATGLDRRSLQQVIRTLRDDPDLIRERLDSDEEFRDLAREFLAASRSRMAGGRALVGLGVSFMLLSVLIGTPLWFGMDSHVPAIAVWGGVGGGGLVLFVPGVAVMSTPSSAERELLRVWERDRQDWLRPEARGPRLRISLASRPSWVLPLWGVSF